eukprot:1157684-Pelagomonas_calceolata.AAC.2
MEHRAWAPICCMLGPTRKKLEVLHLLFMWGRGSKLALFKHFGHLASCPSSSIVMGPSKVAINVSIRLPEVDLDGSYGV